MSAADRHLDASSLTDYWAGDLSAEDEAAHDEHLFSCEPCSQLSARVAAITETLRRQIPPLLSPEALARLTARGLKVVENAMRPGERLAVAFPKEADILLHRLGGLDLEGATRVSFEMRVESSGELIVALDDVPLDRARGELLVACQQHFRVYPPDTQAEVRVHAADGGVRVSTYTILHQW